MPKTRRRDCEFQRGECESPRCTHTENMSLSFKDFRFDSGVAKRDIQEKRKNTTLMEIFKREFVDRGTGISRAYDRCVCLLNERSQNYEPRM